MIRHGAAGTGPRSCPSLVTLASLLIVFSVAACSAAGSTSSLSAEPSPTVSILASAPTSRSPSPSSTPAPSASATASGGFAPTGSMTVGRDGHTATLLADGRVLVAGGLENADSSHPLSSAELYDPATGEFSPTGSMSIPRSWHTATLLQDGRVLIVGGYDSDDFTGTGEAPAPAQSVPAVTPGPPDPRRIAELYDPKTGTFSRTGSMAVDRYGHTATLLNDGRVLIAGGESLAAGDNPSGGTLASAELYDPGTGTFNPTGSMTVPRTGHTATLLADGRVLIAGGSGDDSAELYDPITGRFGPTGSLSIARTNHTATLLADGRVLISGGVVATDSNNPTASAEIYDPMTGTFSPTGSMTTARASQTATLLADGQVLVTGGSWSTGDPGLSAELYDPTTGTFSPTGSMDAQHDTATRLSDGSVLITGGAVSIVGGSESLATAELYRP